MDGDGRAGASTCVNREAGTGLETTGVSLAPRWAMTKTSAMASRAIRSA